MKITLLVVQHSALVREGLVRLLNADPEIEVVAEAGTGIEALNRARECCPNAILLDSSLPGLDSIAVTRLLTREVPSAKVILMSVGDATGDDVILEAVKAGARGYVGQSATGASLIQHIKQVASGGVALSPENTGKLLDSLVKDIRHSDANIEPDLVLTAREKAVLNLICQGAPNKQIATTLFVSQNTVRAHVRSLMLKLNADNRTRLAYHAMRYGFGLREMAPPQPEPHEARRNAERGHKSRAREEVQVRGLAGV